MRETALFALLCTLLSPMLAFGGTPDTVHDFAQIGDGGGVRTIILIMNRNQAAVSVTISFFTGDPGTPWQLSIGGTTTAVFETEVPARGFVRLVTSGAGAAPQAGWARLIASNIVGAQVLFEIRSGEDLLTQAAVESTPPLTSTDLFVEEGGGSGTGLAIASLSPRGRIRVLLTLTDEDGEAAGETEFILGARGHKAQFLSQLFQALESFRGTLTVRASGPFTIVTLQQTGLVLGSLPPVWPL